jgi:PhnB protein
MPVQPYLFFEGRCEEAAEFYRKALGAETCASRKASIPACARPAPWTR